MGVTMFLMCTCAYVSIVVTPPFSSSSLSFSLSLQGFHTSPPPPLCLSCCVLPLGSQWRTPASPLHRWRESSPTLHTHTMCNYSALWKSYRDLVILVEQANWVFPYSTACFFIQAAVLWLFTLEGVVCIAVYWQIQVCLFHQSLW